MKLKTVLVVDDIKEQRDIYTALLEHHGYRVVEADGGELALRLAREARPDVILLDMMMAVVDGWEVTERLKEDPATAPIPVVALTVLGSDEDRERARSAGATSYLIKPCPPAAMLEEVRRLIGLPTRVEAG